MALMIAVPCSLPCKPNCLQAENILSSLYKGLNCDLLESKHNGSTAEIVRVHCSKNRPNKFAIFVTLYHERPRLLTASLPQNS